MMNIYRSGILLGMGILLAGTFATTDSASAAPRRGGDRGDLKEKREDVREARKDVREERKDVRQANTVRDHMIQNAQLREAERKLDREKRDLNRERRDNNHNDGNNRPDRWDNDRRDNDRWDNDRRRDNDRWDNGRWDNDHRWDNDRYNNGHWNNGRWDNANWNNGNYGGWGNNGRSDSLEGVVINDLQGNDFVIRTNNGRQIRVIAVRGESSRISRGDIVRVYGYNDGGTFRASSVNVIRDR